MQSLWGSMVDEALGQGVVEEKGRVVLIQDTVDTSGAFLLHHLIKRSLSSSSSVLLFLSLARPFSQYDRILRKLGCNLTFLKENGRFFFFDVLKQLKCPDGDGAHDTEGGLIELYGNIQKAVQMGASARGNGSCVTIMVDDLSLLEIAAHGSTNHVLDFVHYCHTLTSEMDCLLVLLTHGDIYSNMVAPGLISSIEYLADVIIKAEPLATGLSTDVHGQLTVVNKGILSEHGRTSNWIRNFHFKVKENGVEYFYPGTGT